MVKPSLLGEDSMTTVCIYKVEHKLVKELSREEGEKLVEFIESGSHIYRVDED